MNRRAFQGDGFGLGRGGDVIGCVGGGNEHEQEREHEWEGRTLWGAHAPRVWMSAPSPTGRADCRARKRKVRFGEGAETSARGRARSPIQDCASAYSSSSVQVCLSLPLPYKTFELVLAVLLMDRV